MIPERGELLKDRVGGLDTVRCWAALCVLTVHLGGLPLKDGIDTTTQIGRAFAGFYDLFLQAHN